MTTGDADFDTLFTLVGRVASAYAGLDIRLREALGKLLGDTKRSRATADQPPTEVVIKAVERSIKVDPADPALDTYVGWVLSAARRAGTERAAVAHSSWYLVEDHSTDWYANAVSAKNRSAEHRKFSFDDLLKLEAGVDAVAGLISSLSWLADRPAELGVHLRHPATERSHELVVNGLGGDPYSA